MNSQPNFSQYLKDIDMLELFQNLSSHEIFTPLNVVESMLDLLPQEIFENPQSKFLDPGTKTGIYLRQILFRLYSKLPMTIITGQDGKTYDLSNHQERINHILKNQIFGIAISETTAYLARRILYGVREANGDKVDADIEMMVGEENSDNKYANTDSAKNIRENKIDKIIENGRLNSYYDKNIFDLNDIEGNIFYPHQEIREKVKLEGDEDFKSEKFYPFIHETVHTKINLIKNGDKTMKFDVIIGNPPYQISNGKSSAIPIYHQFIENSIGLNPKYLSMIVPSRWMQGGKGLDKFREFMLNDNRIKKIVDFKNASDCFPSVDIKGGINYFLWNQEYSGLCKYSLNKKENNEIIQISEKERQLNEFELLIRDNFSIDIINKVKLKSDHFMNEKVFGQTPFGLISSFNKFNLNKNIIHDIKLFGNVQNMKDSNGIGYINIDKVTKNKEIINKHKVFIPKAMGKGNDGIYKKAFYGEPNSVCTQTYLVVDYFNTKEEAENLIIYLNTNFVSFLIKQLKITQDAMKKVYSLVPVLPMNKIWTDKELYEKYNLTQEEINYIEESMKELK